MKKRATMLVIGLMALVAGCSEGGIGGTGSVVEGPAPLMVFGQANKGPFGPGAVITAARLDQSTVQVQSQTTGKLGEFSLALVPGETYLLNASGTYFSELTGSDAGTNLVLAAIVQPEAGEPVNVNVATHVIHQRVLALLGGNSGVGVDTAIATATNELVLALTSVLPAPVNPMVFSELLLINAAQNTRNDEGNAWLLALSALLETAGGQHVSELLNAMTQGFASSGTLDVSILAQLNAAIGQIDPDTIMLNLINLEPAFSRNALVNSGAFTAAEAASVDCRVFSSRLLCAGSEPIPAGSFDSALGQLASADSQAVSVSALVADLNQFIDTDRDGLVNTDDADDDNDGIEDLADVTPYDNQLPVTPGGVL
jgi:hypothetical protein